MPVNPQLEKHDGVSPLLFSRANELSYRGGILEELVSGIEDWSANDRVDSKQRCNGECKGGWKR
jgi:hypothetical protein